MSVISGNFYGCAIRALNIITQLNRALSNDIMVNLLGQVRTGSGKSVITQSDKSKRPPRRLLKKPTLKDVAREAGV